MISRALFADAAKVANGEVSKAGPLVEYERRIEAGDLVGGHNCQKHKGVPDPLEFVAGEISDESILLCLDEFMVADVADALILNRLFSNGVILVATSNRAPDNRYEGGLQRDRFLPFISTLKERCVVLEIGSSTDYRKITSVPLGANRCAYFPFEELCDKPLGAADYLDCSANGSQRKDVRQMN